MEGMAVAMFHKACTRLPDASAVDGRAVNPYAIGLDAGRWEADGLFDEPGLTREQALERAEGIQTIWLDELADAPPPTFAKPPF